MSGITNVPLNGNPTVQSYAHTWWLLKHDILEIRAATLYDIDTEVEVIQEELYELLDSYTFHWSMRTYGTALITAEFFDFFYIRLQMDFQPGYLDPFAMEYHQPDYLSGHFQRIDELGYQDCFGFYSNMDAFKTQFSLSFNFKKCDASIADWMSGKGEAGPGFHIYCYYDNDYEFDIVNPFFWDGFAKKYVMWETCWDDTAARNAAEHLIWNDEDFTWFWDTWRKDDDE